MPEELRKQRMELRIALVKIADVLDEDASDDDPYQQRLRADRDALLYRGYAELDMPVLELAEVSGMDWRRVYDVLDEAHEDIVPAPVPLRPWRLSLEASPPVDVPEVILDREHGITLVVSELPAGHTHTPGLERPASLKVNHRELSGTVIDIADRPYRFKWVGPNGFFG